MDALREAVARLRGYERMADDARSERDRIAVETARAGAKRETVAKEAGFSLRYMYRLLSEAESAGSNAPSKAPQEATSEAPTAPNPAPSAPSPTPVPTPTTNAPICKLCNAAPRASGSLFCEGCA